MRETPIPLASRDVSPAAAIVLDKVHLTLEGPAGPVNILRGVDLSVNAGTALGVVGPSGSGKTTMLMIVAGLERISAGCVTIAGTDYAALDEDALALFRRDAVGIVFQSFHLIPTMTALENVAVPLEFAGRADAFDRAEAQLKAVGLGHRIDHYPGQLSGGEQQRVALARAFAIEPKILLADEPTGNLDGVTGQQIIELLFQLHDQHNTTLVLITHDLNLAKRCERVVRIADGLIVGEGLRA
ncbi:MAG: ABC transporter ATP-binding protein [Rhodospirillaceae bacterium]|nr:ABC transporter ATP-binding protein [Rhodospirillaceae bacterium]